MLTWIAVAANVELTDCVTGWEVLAPHIVYAPVRAPEEERHRQLNAWAERLRGIESEKPIDVGEY